MTITFKFLEIRVYRQAATEKQLEKLRSEDVSFESLLEGNDSIFTNNLQGALTLGDVDKGASDKFGPGNNYYFYLITIRTQFQICIIMLSHFYKRSIDEILLLNI